MLSRFFRVNGIIGACPDRIRRVFSLDGVNSLISIGAIISTFSRLIAPQMHQKPVKGMATQFLKNVDPRPQKFFFRVTFEFFNFVLGYNLIL